MSTMTDQQTVDSSSESFNVYLQETRRPLVSIAFLTPLLVIYELGAAAQIASVTRNGADVLLRNLLFSAEVDRAWLLPIIVVAVLLLWHHLTGDNWRFQYSTLAGMACESLGIAILLLATAKFLNHWLVGVDAPALFTTGNDINAQTGVNGSEAIQPVSNMISYLGAGVYEELVFRLLLIPPLLLIAVRIVPKPWQAAAIVIGATSLLFAAAHYQPLNPAGSAIDLQSAEFLYAFCFRTVAGGIFGLIFLKRGFGVVVGAHAAYDIMAISI